MFSWTNIFHSNSKIHLFWSVLNEHFSLERTNNIWNEHSLSGWSAASEASRTHRWLDGRQKFMLCFSFSLFQPINPTKFKGTFKFGIIHYFLRDGNEQWWVWRVHKFMNSESGWHSQKCWEFNVCSSFFCCRQ